MEKKLNCQLELSLQQMALRRVAIDMWNETDILASIENFQYDSQSQENLVDIWRERVECKIEEKVSKLALPASLRKKMMQLVKPMSSDTLRWKMHHEFILSGLCEHYGRPSLKQSIRAYTGAIDYRKTAEELARLEMLDIVKRYKVACLYCLVDYIPVLWEKLPDRFLKLFNIEEHPMLAVDSQLEFYWAVILKGEESKLDDLLGVSFYPFVFDRSACKGNKAATEYFFQKLPQEERESCLFSAVIAVLESRYRHSFHSVLWDCPVQQLSEVLSYLLSQMNPEQQMQVLKEHPCDVLRCFLNWPWQDVFLDIADVIWTFLPESIYDELMSLFIVRDETSDNYSPDFFQKVFLRCPKNFRKLFVSRYAFFFSEIFNALDTETIKIIFRNIDFEDRVNLVRSYKFFNSLDDLILMRDRWHLIELCLREATLSKEEMKRLYEGFMIFLRRDETREMRMRRRNWQQFFENFDETYASARNKRSSVGERPTKAKKLCNKKRKGRF